jgi:hypothetical protein
MKPPYRELVTINGKNVVLSHNEPPVINAGVLENADIFRMINIFADKLALNIDRRTARRCGSTLRPRQDRRFQAAQARHGLLASQHRRPRDHLLRQGRS